ncbi:MAG: hypothetical protein CL537_02970 [Alcanivoracaceae bacterium]|nr:hypothetical protein [Alcanivoracaceae bacterium]|tara:strand:- start:5453 stop:5977 length:525 start_codon:yes stop_codon:yes gene_type:complete
MNLLARILYRLTANRPTRLIKIEGKPYMERYFIGQLLGLTIYLHRFVRDDHERSLHNHPWNHAVSLVLTGRYSEHHAPHARWVEHDQVIAIEQIRKVSWFNHITRATLHRIAQVKPETWTLFIHTDWQHHWGFLKRLGMDWPHYEYRIYRSDLPRKWWLDAPTGKHIGRQPFGA